MRLCIPLSFLKSSSIRRRRSKDASRRLDPEEAPFTYFSVEPSQTLYSSPGSQYSHYNDNSYEISRTNLISIPKTERFRSVAAWLQSQESVSAPPCCPDSPDSHYACTDVTRSTVSYRPDTDTYGSCIPDRGTFSPELRGVFSSPVGRCRSAESFSEHYSCPDTSRRQRQSGVTLSSGSSPVSLDGSAGWSPARHSSQHVRTVSLPCENTEYIYLDFGPDSRQQQVERQSGTWQVTKKPVQSPVRRSFA
jgi:hypothetical protein